MKEGGLHGDSPVIVSYSIVSFIVYLFQILSLLIYTLLCKYTPVIHYDEISCASKHKQAGQRWTQETLRRISGGYARGASKSLTTTRIRTTNSLKEARVKLFLLVIGIYRDNGEPEMPVC